jgi:ABC-type phosphate transport system substrate-binding protein
MNKNAFAWLNGLLLWCALVGSAHAELAVIVHPSLKLVGISKEEVSDIYLARTRTFPNGAEVERVDQESDSAARKQFMKGVLDLDEGEWKSFWAKQIFTGKAKPPQVLSGDAAVRDWVAVNPEGLGYVQGKYVDSSVKVLLILP